MSPLLQCLNHEVQSSGDRSVRWKRQHDGSVRDEQRHLSGGIRMHEHPHKTAKQDAQVEVSGQLFADLCIVFVGRRF
jgi:hypothetical protein